VRTNYIIVVLCVLTMSQYCLASNYTHLKTFGFDYRDLSGEGDQARWLAKHHDWIIGPQNGGLTINTNLIMYEAYTEIMGANKNAKIASYVPYSTVFPYTSEWMEDWCRKNGLDPEELYLHYEEDVTVNTTKGRLNVPGYGKGSAKNIRQSRVTSKWWGGLYPNINPASEVFRRAFNEYALKLVTVKDTRSVYVHGLFLDSYNATTETDWPRELSKTIEFRKIGVNTESKALSYMEKMLVKHSVEMENFLKRATNQKDFVVIVNAGLAEYMYKEYVDLFVGQRDGLMNVCIEELGSSTIDDRRIPFLKNIYDDLENGRVIWIRSQTNYTRRDKKTIPPAFIQALLSVHYLINHKNAYFSYHEGSPSFYGGDTSGILRNTHWHINQEIDIGQPIKRDGKDYWGEKNTNRFYVFDKDEKTVVLARMYSKGMVLVKIPKVGSGGWDNIGKNKKKYVFDKEYKLLKEDNTLSEKIYSIELGNTEGAILMN